MISIDGEFTGLNHLKHSIVSLGAVDFLNPTNQFYAECRIWEGATWEDEALKINGFSVKEIQDPNKISLVQLIKKFDDWLKTCPYPQILIGQNPKSDIDFLVESYKKAGLEYPLGHRSIDTHSVVFAKHLELGKKILLDKGKFKINLDESLNFVGIPGGEPKPHIALMGAKCAAEVISRTIYGKKLLSEFEGYEVPEYLRK
nr:exonuclease domain-containing protein [Candidatus Gracilibacteria bacterium]